MLIYYDLSFRVGLRDYPYESSIWSVVNADHPLGVDPKS